MKPTSILMACLVMTSHAQTTPATPTPVPTPAALYQQGVKAMEKGEIETARSAFEAVLRARPNDPNTLYQLGELKRRSPEIAAKGRELRFGRTLLPDVSFSDCTLPEALTALSSLVAKTAGPEAAPNFVIKDPAGKLATKTIALKLHNIPAGAVLKYLLEQSASSAKFEEHAIVISPRPGS